MEESQSCPLYCLLTHPPTQQGAFCSDPVLSAGWESWCIQRGADDGPELLGLPLSPSFRNVQRNIECAAGVRKISLKLHSGLQNAWTWIEFEYTKRQGWTIQKTAGTVTPYIQRSSVKIGFYSHFSNKHLKSVLRNCISLYFQPACLYLCCIFKRAFMAPPGVLWMNQAVNPWETDQWAWLSDGATIMIIHLSNTLGMTSASFFLSLYFYLPVLLI